MKPNKKWKTIKMEGSDLPKTAESLIFFSKKGNPSLYETRNFKIEKGKVSVEYRCKSGYPYKTTRF